MPIRHRRLLSRLWRALAEAPYLPIAAYLGLVGILSLLSGGGVAPESVQDTLPVWLTFAWTIGIAAGGVLATIGALAQRTRVESAGLGLLAYGAALYGLVVTYAVWPSGFTVAAVSAAVFSMCLIRMRVLSLARHAEEVASTIADADEQEH